MPSVACLVAEAAHDAVLHDQFPHLGIHEQPKAGTTPRLTGEEVEEVPLGHERQIGVTRRQMAEVGQGQDALGGLYAQHRHLRVWPAQQLISQAEFRHDLQRRRVQRVASKVAQEVVVFLQDEHVEAMSGQQEPEHEAGRPAAGDAAMYLMDASC